MEKFSFKNRKRALKPQNHSREQAKSPANKRAFTLIEAIFAIVLLGIIGSIAASKLLASTGTAKARAIKERFEQMSMGISQEVLSQLVIGKNAPSNVKEAKNFITGMRKIGDVSVTSTCSNLKDNSLCVHDAIERSAYTCAILSKQLGEGIYGLRSEICSKPDEKSTPVLVLKYHYSGCTIIALWAYKMGNLRPYVAYPSCAAETAQILGAKNSCDAKGDFDGGLLRLKNCK